MAFVYPHGGLQRGAFLHVRHVMCWRSVYLFTAYRMRICIVVALYRTSACMHSVFGSCVLNRLFKYTDTPSRCAASLLRQDINGCKPHTVSSHKHGRISQLRTVTRTRLSSALSQPSSAFNASREATANKRWQPPEGYNPGSTSPHSRPWVRKPEVLLSSAPTSSFSYVSPNSTDLWTPEGFSKLAPQHIPTFIMEALRKNDFPEIDSGIQVHSSSLFPSLPPFPLRPSKT
jgi:hypothetical protein